MSQSKVLTTARLGLAGSPQVGPRGSRVAMIGYGGIARTHTDAYLKAGYEVVAVADTAADARERARQVLPGAKVFADYGQMLDAVDCDAVGLYTHPTLRTDAIDAAFAHGRPVLTEKPLAGTVTEAKSLAALAAERRLPLAVSQNYRWIGANWVARQLIEAGLVGDPHYVGLQIYGTQDRDLKDHPFYSTCTDFLTVQWNTHLVDLQRYWFGRDATRVWAATRRPAHQNLVSDNFLTTLADFGHGASGQVIHHELLAAGLAGMPCRVDGTEGSIEFHVYGNEVKLSSSRVEGGVPVVVRPQDEMLPSMAYSMGDLLLSARDGREPVVSAARNLGTLTQVFAEDRSAHAGGTWIDLPAT